MKNRTIKESNTRKVVWAGLALTGLLVSFAIHKNMEGAASAMFVAGIGSTFGLYGNKHIQERKSDEITK